MTTELYQQKFKDKWTPKYKVWQEIIIELYNLGYKVAANEKESGKKCYQKWRNLENKYNAFKDNANQTGEAAKKKPMYYDVYAIKIVKDKIKEVNFNNELRVEMILIWFLKAVKLLRCI